MDRERERERSRRPCQHGERRKTWLERERTIDQDIVRMIRFRRVGSEECRLVTHARPLLRDFSQPAHTSLKKNYFSFSSFSSNHSEEGAP